MSMITVDYTTHRPIRRILLTLGGLIFVAIAIVGVLLPGIPTTGPLILASILLGKANPDLRERVLAMKMLAPYRGYVDGSKKFTRALRCWALLCMWISISLSCCVLYATSNVWSIAIPGCLAGGMVGSLVIFWYQPKRGSMQANPDGTATESSLEPSLAASNKAPLRRKRHSYNPFRESRERRNATTIG